MRDRLPRILGMCLVALISLSAVRGWANRPVEFRRTRVFFQPNVQARHFLGPLSDQSSWSIGMGVSQGAFFGPWGVVVTLDTDFFLSTQSPPPFNSGVQIAGLGLAGRYTYPFRDFHPFVELGYRYLGFVSNSLVAQTGPDLNFNALGTAGGLRIVALRPLYFEVRGSWDWVWDLDGTSLVGIGVAIGVRSVL